MNVKSLIDNYEEKLDNTLEKITEINIQKQQKDAYFDLLEIKLIKKGNSSSKALKIVEKEILKDYEYYNMEIILRTLSNLCNEYNKVLSVLKKLSKKQEKSKVKTKAKKK